MLFNYYDKQGNRIDEIKLNELYSDPEYARVAKTVLDYGMTISTVWLGFNYAFDKKKDLLIFETMVFPRGFHDEEVYMERYSTEEEAIAGHERIVKMVQDGELY